MRDWLIVCRSIGFFPCKIEPDMWMRKVKDDIHPHCEDIAVYADDLLIASKSPQAITDQLTNKYDFKLKGAGPIKHHLGCDFARDELSALFFAPQKYVKKMSEAYFSYFGSKPNASCSSPLDQGNHPRLDSTPLLDQDGIQQYQSMVGALKWAASLGRLDITAAFMSMSSFQVESQEGHIE